MDNSPLRDLSKEHGELDQSVSRLMKCARIQADIQKVVSLLQERQADIKRRTESIMQERNSVSWGSPFSGSHLLPTLANKISELRDVVTKLENISTDISYENRETNGVEFDEYPEESERYWKPR